MGPSRPKSNASPRSCPTRTDGARALFAHRVSRSQCQERQRESYHKCFTCAWNNACVAANGEPQRVPQPNAEEKIEDASTDRSTDQRPPAVLAAADNRGA